LTNIGLWLIKSSNKFLTIKPRSLMDKKESGGK